VLLKAHLVKKSSVKSTSMLVKKNYNTTAKAIYVHFWPVTDLFREDLMGGHSFKFKQHKYLSCTLL